VTRFADRFLGSPDLYGHEQREAEQSVNFVTCHDGFTLNDLVSYNQKHNEGNGEANRDGCDDNRSWNCGAEGASDDPRVEELRRRQIKNFLTATVLSLGVPMIVMGDEVRRTQYGNNNAYCQDNEIGWFDWSLVARNADLHRFVRLLLARRVLRDIDWERRRVPLNQLIEESEKSWHGVRAHQPDWCSSSHSLAFGAMLRRERLGVHFLWNAYWEPLDFELPPANGSMGWHRWIDTALNAPDDIVDWRAPIRVSGLMYRAEPRSVVVLIAPPAA
jgi:glycogen operon protein